MNELTKETLICVLTEGLDEHVEGKYLTGMTIPETASLSVKKQYLKNRCLMWREQEREEGELYSNLDNLITWLQIKIDEHLNTENQDEFIIGYSTLYGMLNPNDKRIKLNPKIEKFILSSAPKESPILIDKVLFFSDVLNYLLHSNEEYFGIENLMNPNNENIETLRTFSYEKIRKAIDYVDGYHENQSEQHQDDEEEMIDSMEKEIRCWLEEKTIEEIYLIFNYLDKWKLFDKEDFKVWIALYDKENRVKVRDLMKNKRLLSNTICGKLETYNELVKIDWNKLKDYNKNMNESENSVYEEERNALLDNTVSELIMSKYLELKDTLDNHLADTIEHIEDTNGMEEIKAVWYLFLQVFLILTNNKGKIEKEVLDVLGVDEE